MKTVVIAGGSGFLGKSLARYLSRASWDVILLSRHAPKEVGPWRHVEWDGRTIGDWVGSLEDVDALVNFAGRTVDCIKTPDHCDEILRSRVESTRVLGRALGLLEKGPKVWVQMSTAHIYGDPPKARCDEGSATGVGLAPEVAKQWEATYRRAVPEGVRQVVLRTGFVLGRDGGALPRLSKLVGWRLGGTVGDGEQGMSWIHELDMNRIVECALKTQEMIGTYVVAAPEPVSNREFMAALRRAIGISLGLPAPSWLVRLGAPLVMRTDPELALYGRYCLPSRLVEEGFEFEYSQLAAALRDLVGSSRPAVEA